MENTYKWKEISDLPEDVEFLRDRELESLHQVWINERERLGDNLNVSEFSRQLAREWAIETGIIEGVYTLDRGITQTLIERGIDSSYIGHTDTDREPEVVARIIRTHADVLDGIFSFVKGERELSTSYIKELHAALLRDIETVTVVDKLGRCFETTLEKGAYKTMPNNPTRPDGSVHEYYPPEHVASEMDRMIEFHRQHRARDVPAHLEAAWLHHAFTQIHPFQDGNGRVARAIASVVFIKAGYFPLTITRDDRASYIEALELADLGNLASFARLLAKVQKRIHTRAIGNALDVRPVKSVDEALTAARDMLVSLGRIIPKEYLTAKQLAGTLVNVVLGRLNQVTARLRDDISAVDRGYEFATGSLGGAMPAEIRHVGELLKYDPNPTEYHQDLVTTFKARGLESRMVVSFHVPGPAFRGVVVAVAYFQVGGGAPAPLAEDVFRINYLDTQKEIQPRFEKWLDACIIEGLARWRRTLV